MLGKVGLCLLGCDHLVLLIPVHPLQAFHFIFSLIDGITDDGVDLAVVVVRVVGDKDIAGKRTHHWVLTGSLDHLIVIHNRVLGGTPVGWGRGGFGNPGLCALSLRVWWVGWHDAADGMGGDGGL